MALLWLWKDVREDLKWLTKIARNLPAFHPIIWCQHSPSLSLSLNVPIALPSHSFHRNHVEIISLFLITIFHCVISFFKSKVCIIIVCGEKRARMILLKKGEKNKLGG